MMAFVYVAHIPNFMGIGRRVWPELRDEQTDKHTASRTDKPNDVTLVVTRGLFCHEF